MKLKFDGIDLACRRASEVSVELAPGERANLSLGGEDVLIGFVDGGWRIFCSSKVQVNQSDTTAANDHISPP